MNIGQRVRYCTALSLVEVVMNIGQCIRYCTALSLVEVTQQRVLEN